jgi:hypothetical protein
MKLTQRIALCIAAAGVLIAAPADAFVPFTVFWTAPGDDNQLGRASAYDLRYSTVPLSAANFNQATRILGVPVPAVAGTLETFVILGLPEESALYLAIKSVDERGNWSAISNVVLRPGQTAGSDAIPAELSFSAPWPNPARQSVRWSYALPRDAQVQVDVFDAMGRHVHTVASGRRAAGRGDLAWDLHDDRGGPVGAGIYFVKARIDSREWSRRLVVVR